MILLLMIRYCLQLRTLSRQARAKAHNMANPRRKEQGISLNMYVFVILSLRVVMVVATHYPVPEHVRSPIAHINTFSVASCKKRSFFLGGGPAELAGLRINTYGYDKGEPRSSLQVNSGWANQKTKDKRDAALF